MQVSIIAAMGRNRELGLNNSIPWHLKSDIVRFRDMTTAGGTVIMGRKTYESIKHPLKNRSNIVITHELDYIATGCLIAHSLSEALSLIPPQTSEAFFTGAYSLGLLAATRMYLTHVDYSDPADVYFPKFDLADWQIASSSAFPVTSTDQYAYEFVTYDKVGQI